TSQESLLQSDAPTSPLAPPVGLGWPLPPGARCPCVCPVLSCGLLLRLSSLPPVTPSFSLVSPALRPESEPAPPPPRSRLASFLPVGKKGVRPGLPDPGECHQLFQASCVLVHLACRLIRSRILHSSWRILKSRAGLCLLLCGDIDLLSILRLLRQIQTLRAGTL